MRMIPWAEKFVSHNPFDKTACLSMIQLDLSINHLTM